MKKRIYKVLLFNVLLFLVFITYYVINQKTNFYIPCVFRLITGLKCPGCGITHYLFDMVNLDFSSAFMDNPLVFIYLPLFLIYYVIGTYNYIKYNDRNKIMIPNYVSYILIIMALIFGVVRNIWNF